MKKIAKYIFGLGFGFSALWLVNFSGILALENTENLWIPASACFAIAFIFNNTGRKPESH